VLQGCTQSLNKIRETFVGGHGEYELQSIPGFCVRSTDGQYTNDNLTEMYSEGASITECALGCNADETCVAFDYGPTGLCYAYKQDTLADYVGSEEEGW
jgi:hypothetical protein